MRRIPLLPTAVVAAAVLTMIGLGIWQIGRAHQRDAAKAEMLDRASQPAVEFPYSNPDDSDFAYRRVKATCATVRSWQIMGGQSASGVSGWRHIATCQAARSAQGFQADLGFSRDPNVRTTWAGGYLEGHAGWSTDNRTLLQRLLWKPARRQLILIAEQPAPGLALSRQPDAHEEPNTSWGYVGQWFLFAATALLIYVLALRKRLAAAEPRG